MSKLLFGCGYLGRRVACRWLGCGDEVHVVTRTSKRANELTTMGLRPVVADICSPDSLASIPTDVETIVFAVGFDRDGGKSIHHVYVDGLNHVLRRLGDWEGRFIYISSTGVYGQTDGEWIDEDSPCQPQREGGRACLAAEQLLAGHPIGQRTNILRLGGIYGPGRVPRRQQITNGEPIAVPSHGMLNLIHVDDAAEIVLAVEQQAPAPRTYLVTDNEPVLRRDYYREVTRLFDLPEPKFVDPPCDAPAAIRATSDKRICNRRLVTELDVALRYPTYREGLASVVAAEG